MSLKTTCSNQRECLKPRTASLSPAVQVAKYGSMVRNSASIMLGVAGSFRLSVKRARGNACDLNDVATCRQRTKSHRRTTAMAPASTVMCG